MNNQARNGFEVSNPASNEDALQALGSGRILPARQQWVLEMRRYACACSVVVGGQGNGSGILVGPDLVLTNYHVVMTDKGDLHAASNIKCRFGYFETGEFADGRHNWADVNGIVTSSGVAPGDKELKTAASDFVDAAGELYDYALLRLAKPVGASAGKALTGNLDPLGWVLLVPDQELPALGQPVSVVQFPERTVALGRGYTQEASSIGSGKLIALIANGIRVEHSAPTRKGASGGGVFDSEIRLIGLHVAGKDRADKTAENRFIPINRILSDIRRKNEAVFKEMIAANPPDPIAFGLSRKMKNAIEERVAAAKVVLGRQLEHARILQAFAKETVVNQVLYQYKLDGFEYFVRRIREISTARLENRTITEVQFDFLQGKSGNGAAFIAWENGSFTWPRFDASEDEARSDMRLMLENYGYKPRTLLVIDVGDLERRNPATERQFIKLFGEVLWEYANRQAGGTTSRPMYQALVAYRRPAGAFDIRPFSPLWKDTAAPQRCGVSVTLTKLQFNEVLAWAQALNSAWSPEHVDVHENDFGPLVELHMSDALEILNKTISTAATKLVERSVETAG
ncbi:trypsin-like serine peptidase [Bradyrhizobium yuanmingense]|uniref:trypsin-like serine peptidase n=1 Tax=Bradyrhizobium yuanmingense TaxID=108015 RepID=UPI0023B9770C|nr:serine protease [Bradyrhizobium yuanmingense]MDF0495733.1 serine protease [Bradyrhizobium yuanmingense]